ncbi:hypothetical protein VNO77_20743 [Canavalia gladiata]|uniref:Uncharacterized protein n=1 Tax=Canavalia gladiata TaxID=3824 RepID=A0AAN9LQ46_CANGL
MASFLGVFVVHKILSRKPVLYFILPKASQHPTPSSHITTPSSWIYDPHQHVELTKVLSYTPHQRERTSHHHSHTNLYTTLMPFHLHLSAEIRIVTCNITSHSHTSIYYPPMKFLIQLVSRSIQNLKASFS